MIGPLHGNLILPGYSGTGRATQGDLKALDAAMAAKTVRDTMHILRGIKSIDVTPEVLDLVAELGREWGEASLSGKRASKEQKLQKQEQFALRKLRQFYYEVLRFDLVHGTQTSGYIPEMFYQSYAKDHPDLFAQDSLGNVQYGVRHRASLTSVVNEAVDGAAKILQMHNVSPDRVGFRDYGCGTGKPAIIARLRGDFASVIGIDYFAPVLNYGESNKQVMGFVGDKDIKFEFADATKFDQYEEDVIVCYAYNPFGKEVMSPLVKKLEETGKPIIFLYNKPLHIECFESKNGWEIEEKREYLDEDQQLTILTRNMDLV